MREEVNTGEMGLEVAADVFAGSLSPDIVTGEEVSGLSLVAEHIVKDNGVNTTVNGVPATVSEASALRTVDGVDYYVRVFKREGQGQDDHIMGIAFDLTPDVRVVTPNLMAVRFQEFAGHTSLIVDNELDPLVDSPRHVREVKSILLEVADKVAIDRAEKIRLAEIEKIEKAERFKKAIDNTLETIIYYGRPVVAWGLGIVAAGAVVGGIVYGIGKIDFDTPTFDEKEHTLDGGAVLVAGRQVNPEFSTQLLEDGGLESIDVPDIDPGGYAEDEALSSDDTLREDTIGTSNPPDNCETVVVEEIPEGSEVRAWTDFTNRDSGGSRADELTLELRQNDIEVCWNGEELGDTDDPRVVMSIVDRSLDG